jgi:hypothetical protein
MVRVTSLAEPTHVVEIETGIGEPASIPLTLGVELEPISIGTKGMWRIDSARVADVHAFMYFDGTSLFLQSASEGDAASVDGFAVGASWTELRAPCKIEIGAAKLRFRMVGAGEAARPDVPTPVKPERPFKPGEFAHASSQEEETRLKPVEAGDARSNAGVGMARPQPIVSPSSDDNPTRMEGTGNRQKDKAEQTLAMNVAPVQAIPQALHPPAQRMNMTGPLPLPAQPPMGPVHGTGPYNMQAPMPAYTPMAAPGGPGAQHGFVARYIEKYKQLSAPLKITLILAPFCLLSAGYLVAGGGPDSSRTAGADAGASVASATATQPQPGPCPPGFVPYAVPIDGTYPCVPQGTPMPSASGTTTATAVPAADAGSVAPATAANAKTLERQAVDYVAAGNYAAAASVYDQLHQQSPNNRTYSEAARILRAKADAGAQ